VAGNTVVLKVPDQTPLAPLLLGELLRDVLPPGVLNVVTGDGPTTGDALVRHPDVKRLALIGSVETGQRIQRSAAEAGIKHVSLELGGKNPLIVFPDADLERAAAAAVTGMNFTRTAGQSCGSTTRLFLHEDVHDEVLERVVEGARAVRLGHPLDDATQMGPLVSARQHARVLEFVASARAEGARVVAGGGHPEGEAFAAGCYVEPTVLADVTMEMRVAREEIFGPVLSVLRFSGRDEVVAQANALPYGLTGAVWTRDLERAFDVADRLDTGYVWINGSARHFVGAPFSGRKASGTDSEEGFEELVSYTQPKTVWVGLG
jgi:acyl-CoA reductase-like NAD-dependent aldehyde dehydrogenase